MATVLFHWIHECICRSVNCACFSVFQRHVREDPPVRSTAWIKIILKRLDAENTFSVIFPFLLCHLEVAGVFRSSLVVFERLYSQRVISSLKKTTTKLKNNTTKPHLQLPHLEYRDVVLPVDLIGRRVEPVALLHVLVEDAATFHVAQAELTQVEFR